MPDSFGTDSVRLDILRHIKALYEAVTDDPVPPVGQVYYGITFSSVNLGPLGDVDSRRLTTIGIVTGTEEKEDLFPLKQPQLEVVVEFRRTINQGDDPPQVVGERLLAVVQQVMIDDRTLGGKVIQVDEIANELDLYTYADRTVQGLVRFRVQYRHHAQNVYSTDPSE